MATQRRHRGPVRLAIAGLVAGTLAFAAGTPAIAAEDEKILVYEGNTAIDVAHSRFGEAVGLPLERSSLLPPDLSSYACIVLSLNTTFDTQTTDALVTYVNEGGNLLALGDNAQIPGLITAMNSLAEALDASMTLTGPTVFEEGRPTDNIDPTPLTDGVASIGYMWTAGVSIAVDGTAQSLVRTKTGSLAPDMTIIAAETIGTGTFVLSGDSSVFHDAGIDYYANYDNDVLARNLCLGSLVQYSFEGFIGPVDEDVVNTVKGGSTVPLQFRVFDGDTEITDPAVVDSFSLTRGDCTDEEIPAEDVEFTTTGKTGLRYTDGKFQQNWKTPKTKGCYQVTVSTTDGATLTADFVLR